MWMVAFKLALSAGVISFSSWLAGKKPELAGFIIALPLMTLLALPFSYLEFHDSAASVRFAQSILVAVPLSCVFFVPFLFADKLGWGFPALYLSGFALLVAAYFAHRAVLQFF